VIKAGAHGSGDGTCVAGPHPAHHDGARLNPFGREFAGYFRSIGGHRSMVRTLRAVPGAGGRTTSQNGGMTLDFRPDLYRGTADYYDRYRPPYPDALIDDLVRRTGADGTGRLLDLACGTGHACFALRGWFAEIWAVDQEPEMISLVRHKAAALADPPRFAFRTEAAENLAAPEDSFDLVTIGNAFHRLPRDVIAAKVLHWLRPGAHLALLWPGSPNDGDAPWQQALQEQMRRWLQRPGAEQRLPAGYQADRAARPDLDILRAAGFEIAGRREFAVSLVWTAAEIAGFVASTSILSPGALGPNAAAFDVSLRQVLLEAEPAGQFRQDTTFACDLARRPD
jgi:SAM-dependent methyltransferase